MSIHKEIHFEDEVCADLAAAGWLYDPADAACYDRTQALFVDEVRAGLFSSQGQLCDGVLTSYLRVH